MQLYEILLPLLQENKAFLSALGTTVVLPTAKAKSKKLSTLHLREKSVQGAFVVDQLMTRLHQAQNLLATSTQPNRGDIMAWRWNLYQQFVRRLNQLVIEKLRPLELPQDVLVEMDDSTIDMVMDDTSDSSEPASSDEEEDSSSSRDQPSSSNQDVEIDIEPHQPLLPDKELLKQFRLDKDQLLSDDVESILPESVAENQALTKEVALSEFLQSPCSSLNALSKSGRFVHKHPELFYETSHSTIGRTKKRIQKTIQRAPRPALTLNYRDFKNLCQITFGHGKSSGSLRMTDADHLIQAFGGKVIPTTGSIDRIEVPKFGSRATTWHGSHGGGAVGPNVAKGLRRVLRHFGLRPIDFEYVEVDDIGTTPE
jgi:hypothetical protein